MSNTVFSLAQLFQRASCAAFAIMLLTPGSSHALTVLDFSSGTWDLPATNGDFYRQESFLVATDNGVVDRNSPANGNWSWGDSRGCSGFGCGGAILRLTTVTFNEGLDLFDFEKVTILENSGGMTFTADGGLTTTFAAGDIGLKTLSWAGISVLQVRNLANPTGSQGSSNIVHAYIDNFQLAPIPEPEIYAMMAVGLGMLGYIARRKKRGESP